MVENEPSNNKADDIIVSVYNILKDFVKLNVRYFIYYVMYLCISYQSLLLLCFFVIFLLYMYKLFYVVYKITNENEEKLRSKFYY